MSSSLSSPSTARTPARPVLPDVLAEHLEEHGFLSLQRRKLIVSVEFPLRRLPFHDDRIAAHWDGLVVGGEASVKLALEKLEADDPWLLASALRVWLELGRATPAAFAEKLAAVPPALAPAWREALRGVPAELAAALLPARTIGAWPAPAFAVALDALAWHGALSDALVAAALRHADADVRAALARALPHAGLGEPLAALEPLLDDAAPAVARRALWGVARLDSEAACERARRAVRGATPEPFALRVLGLLGAPEDHAALAAAAATDRGRLAAVWAFADMGSDDAIESLLRLLPVGDTEFALVVTAALEHAIGVVPREDADAPPPPAEARAHWAQVGETLPRGARVLAGHALPWREEADDEPMRWLWRAAVSGDAHAPEWLAREVPDGWFEAVPAPDARPGE